MQAAIVFFTPAAGAAKGRGGRGEGGEGGEGGEADGADGGGAVAAPAWANMLRAALRGDEVESVAKESGAKGPRKGEEGRGDGGGGRGSGAEGEVVDDEKRRSLAEIAEIQPRLRELT